MEEFSFKIRAKKIDPANHHHQTIPLESSAAMKPQTNKRSMHKNNIFQKITKFIPVRSVKTVTEICNEREAM